jgi:hypothetical protein
MSPGEGGLFASELSGGGGGGGDVTPQGISPAKAEAERRQASNTAMVKRFMLFLLWKLRMQNFLHWEDKTGTRSSCN